MNETLGFIGLGNMGGRMSRRLRAAGYRVLGFDLRPDLARQLDLTPATSVAEVCEAEIVLLSLPDDRAVEQVVLGPGGIRDSARAGLIVVDMSTADADAARTLHSRLAERGVDYLDAPISGGASGAAAGTLAVMVGGSAETLERVRPVLEVVGKRIFHMGGPGNGRAAKAVNNFLNGISLAATSEAMVVGVKAGLDPTLLLEVLNAGSGRNYATERRFPHIVKGDYLEGGLTSLLMAKDLDVYGTLARQVGAPSLLGDVCRAVFSIAIAMGYGEKISNRVVDAMGDLAGGVRIQD